MSRQEANLLFETHLDELGWPFQREFKFHPRRKWRADYYLETVSSSDMETVCERILVEIEGGAFVRGRHTRGKGYENDCEKYNAAQQRGYKVLRFTTGQVLRGEAKEFLMRWTGRG